jgi:SAM-dependent methyltransferase
MAFFYEQFFRWFPPYRKLLNEIIEKVGSNHSCPVYFLDAGCGAGLMSVELARQGYLVVGIDRSPEMLKQARKKQRKEKLDNILFLEGDLNMEISVHKYSFHKALFIHSLYLLDDPGLTLRNLGFTLCREGEIIMCNPWRKLTFWEIWVGGRSFLLEAVRERGFFSIFFFLGIALAMAALNFVIQHRKKKVYHCWDEKGITEVLKTGGFKVRWLKKSCLANSHLLLCAVKER